MNGTIITKDTLAKRALDLVAGTQKHSPNGSITLGGQAFTTATLVQLLQELAAGLAAADAAKAAWKQALTSAVEVQAKALPVLRAYQSSLLATYGNAPSTLADFGLAPRKVPTPQSADAKAAAVAKRAATRQARHTMGKKQKAKITGTVTPTAPATATPATTPVAPSPAASAPTQGTTGVTAPHAS